MTQVAHNAPEREAWKSPDWRAWGGKAANWLRFLFLYVFEGHIIVDLGRWIVLFCGRVSETAMLLATLWITATFVIPEFTTKLGNLAVVLSSLSMVAFSLLPEVILFSAIIKTFKHWLAAWHNKRSPASWAWAVLYSVPTITFFAMTIYTITSFVSTNGHIQTTTGSGLVLRCLAGWFYSLVGLIHANIAKQKNEPQEPHVDTHTPSVFDVMRQELATIRDQQTADLQAVLVRLEAQQKERLQTTVELVMERVTQTVFAQVAVPQIGSASDLTHEQQRTLSERITERISEQIPNDDQTRERTIAEQIPNDGANNSFGEQFVQSEHITEHAANQIVRSQSADDRTNTERWSEQEPSTEPLFVPNESPNESFAPSERAANQIVRSVGRKDQPVGKPTGTEMTKKVQAILKKNPNAGPTFIAQKLDISKGYASELKTRVTAN